MVRHYVILVLKGIGLPLAPAHAIRNKLTTRAQLVNIPQATTALVCHVLLGLIHNIRVVFQMAVFASLAGLALFQLLAQRIAKIARLDIFQIQKGQARVQFVLQGLIPIKTQDA